MQKSLNQTIKDEHNNTQTVPHFINITNTLSLDKSSRSEVRAQVMKDYHRRRKVGGKAKDGNDPSQVPTPTSAECMIGKFRFGQERVLRPWKPVKAARGKGKGRGRNLAASASGTERRNPTFKLQVLQQPNGIEGESGRVEWLNTTQVDPEAISSTLGELPPDLLRDQDPLIPIDHSDINLGFALQTQSLYHSPSTGAFDPFAAMSVLVTPRTQLLLHHYCKCFLLLPSLNNFRKSSFSYFILGIVTKESL
jgi:hypothetical protein